MALPVTWHLTWGNEFLLSDRGATKATHLTDAVDALAVELSADEMAERLGPMPDLINSWLAAVRSGSRRTWRAIARHR